MMLATNSNQEDMMSAVMMTITMKNAGDNDGARGRDCGDDGDNDDDCCVDGDNENLVLLINVDDDDGMLSLVMTTMIMRGLTRRVMMMTIA